MHMGSLTVSLTVPRRNGEAMNRIYAEPVQGYAARPPHADPATALRMMDIHAEVPAPDPKTPPAPTPAPEHPDPSPEPPLPTPERPPLTDPEPPPAPIGDPISSPPVPQALI